MTHPLYARLLGTPEPDRGCEEAFEALDRYVDALLHQEDVGQYAHVVAHIRNCPDCREDTEGLLEAMKNLSLVKGR